MNRFKNKYVKLFEQFENESKIQTFFDKYLPKCKYTINDDGSVDSPYYINLSNMGLNEIPFKFNKVGDFNINHNKLTSLKNSPKEVKGDFICSENLLTSLEYGPSFVGGDYYCNYNNLESLSGAPNRLNGGSFIANNNKNLKSMYGIPSFINYGVNIRDTKIYSFEYFPTITGSRKTIYLTNELKCILAIIGSENIDLVYYMDDFNIFKEQTNENPKPRLKLSNLYKFLKEFEERIFNHNGGKFEELPKSDLDMLDNFYDVK